MGVMSEKSPEHCAEQAYGVLFFGAAVIGALMAAYFWVSLRTVNPKILDRGVGGTGPGICASCADPRRIPRGIEI
jgi:hypothetical protein